MGRGTDPRTGKVFWSGTDTVAKPVASLLRSRACMVISMFWDFSSLFHEASRRPRCRLLQQRQFVTAVLSVDQANCRVARVCHCQQRCDETQFSTTCRSNPTSAVGKPVRDGQWCVSASLTWNFTIRSDTVFACSGLPLPRYPLALVTSLRTLSS